MSHKLHQICPLDRIIVRFRVGRRIPLAGVLRGRGGCSKNGWWGSYDRLWTNGNKEAEHEILTVSGRICSVEIFCSILSNAWPRFASILVPSEAVLKLI